MKELLSFRQLYVALVMEACYQYQRAEWESHNESTGRDGIRLRLDREAYMACRTPIPGGKLIDDDILSDQRIELYLSLMTK